MDDDPSEKKDRSSVSEPILAFPSSFAEFVTKYQKIQTDNDRVRSATAVKLGEKVREP